MEALVTILRQDFTSQFKNENKLQGKFNRFYREAYFIAFVIAVLYTALSINSHGCMLGLQLFNLVYFPCMIMEVYECNWFILQFIYFLSIKFIDPSWLKLEGGETVVSLFIITRFILIPEVYEMYCGLMPANLLLKDGSRYQLNWFSPVLIDPMQASNNICAWRCIFKEPFIAQASMSDRVDGKMSQDVINQLMKDGVVDVYVDTGLLRASNANTGISIYINDGHASDMIPYHVLNKTSPFLIYAEEPVGLLLPKVSPRIFRQTDAYDKMEKIISDLKPFIGKDRMGRIAECGYIAAREEFDIIEELSLKPDLQRITSDELSRSYLSNSKWSVYDVNRKVWMRGANPNSGKYSVEENDLGIVNQIVWTGSRFLNGEWKRRCRPIFTDEDGVRVYNPGPYVLMMSDLPYRRGLAYGQRALNLLNSDYYCNVILEEGVPSCGKTTDICNRSEYEDLICLPSREGAEDYKNKGKVAKTIDSIVVNGWDKVLPVNTLWIDEGLLAHCGALEIMIQMTRPQVCRVYGDRNQLPYIVRISNYKLVNSSYPWTQDPIYHIKAYKNPKVICDILRPLYPKGYVWANDIYGKIYKYNISSMEGVKPGYSVYLTYTQNSKAEVKRYFPSAKVLTINESQGGRYRHVALVRLSIHDIEIYKDRAQNIVALSRAWETFSYFTVKRDDYMSSWLRNKEAYGDPPLMDEKEFNCPSYHHKGGAYSIRDFKALRIAEIGGEDGYEEWREMVARVGENYSPASGMIILPYIPDPTKFWFDVPSDEPDENKIQALMDVMYHRHDRDVARAMRLDWPPKWPEGVSLDMVKSAKTPSIEPRPALHPKFECPHYERALRHPADVAIAAGKRVVGAVRQKLDYNPKLSDILVKGVMRCGDPSIISKLNCLMPCDCEEMKRRWFFTRDGNKKIAILKTEIEKTNGSKYYCIVRSDHKPQLDDSHIDGIPPGQLVTASDPFWSSVFAPIFQTILIKFLAFLKPNIVFSTRMTWEEMDCTIDNLLSGHDFKVLELDISKFDKSQDETMLDAQCKIFKIFGMDEWLVELWRAFHELSKLTFPTWGARFTVGYQRRSGDALTWFGNTLVLLMILAYLYPIEKSYMSILGGDDNITCWPEDIKIIDHSKRAAEELNFEIKPLSFSNSMYFCSRFIILTRNGWTTVPDPVKSIVRFGRKDLQGEEHLQAIHDSVRSLHYKYADPEVRDILDEAAVSRYNETLGKDLKSVKIFIDAVAGVYNNFKYFKSLYTGTKEEWALTLDPYEVIGGGLYEKLVDVYTDD